MEAEAEIQRVKARQAFLDNLAVMVAMTSIVILAVVIVILKSVMFPDDKIITFIPLPQQVKVCLQYRAFESPQFDIACCKDRSIRFFCGSLTQIYQRHYYGTPQRRNFLKLILTVFNDFVSCLVKKIQYWVYPVCVLSRAFSGKPGFFRK
jgi:hypothetical protein